MIPLSIEENESYFKQEVRHKCKKEFITDIDNSSETMFMKYHKARDLCHFS